MPTQKAIVENEKVEKLAAQSALLSALGEKKRSERETVIYEEDTLPVLPTKKKLDTIYDGAIDDLIKQNRFISVRDKGAGIGSRGR